jgi:hypothetical protein
MTAAKFVTNPPEACGLVPSIVDRHYQDLIRGKPGELLAAEVLLQPVGQKSRRTKDGWKTEVTYEVVRLEPARDAHTADNIAWNISRAYEQRTSGSEQELLPLNSPSEQRDSLIEALFEWASTSDLSQTDLDARWVDYFGGREHASSETVRAGALIQLMEFARYVGAVEDPRQGHGPDDDDGFGAGEPDDDDHDERSVPQPAFSSGGSA